MFYDLLIFFFFFSQLQYLGLGRDVDKLKVLICPLDKRPADLMAGMIGPLWEGICTPCLGSVGDSSGTTVIFKLFSPLTGCMSGHHACFGGSCGVLFCCADGLVPSGTTALYFWKQI